MRCFEKNANLHAGVDVRPFLLLRKEAKRCITQTSDFRASSWRCSFLPRASGSSREIRSWLKELSLIPPVTTSTAMSSVSTPSPPVLMIQESASTMPCSVKSDPFEPPRQAMLLSLVHQSETMDLGDGSSSGMHCTRRVQ